MPPIQYGAALMQAYLGRSSLTWIAEHTGIPLKRLKQWRREAQFLLVMDWSKPVFSDAFKENLVLHDYSAIQYHFIAAEVSMLEGSLRVILRMPLYKRFSTLGRRLISRHQNDLELVDYDLRLFRRLFLFFLALEHHWPGPAHHQIKGKFLPLAKDVVWPRLGPKEWIEPEFELMQQSVPLSKIRFQLNGKLVETFKPFVKLGDV